MPIRSFLDLDVYQRSYKASIAVNKEITPKLPENEKYDLKDQLSRASKAIPAIIAEGYSRKNHKRAWQKYIDDGIGEANEMIVHLSLAKDLYPNFVDPKLCDKLIEEYNIIGKQLFRLGKSWNPQSAPPRPDSRLTSHILILLALKVPGPSGSPLEIQAPGVPDVGISPIIQTGVSFLFVTAIILTLFFLIYGGIRWIVSGGNKEKVAQARQTLTYAIIGLIVVLLSYFLINTVFGLFGLEFVGPPVYNPDCGLGRDC